ncbi:MAG: dockerin type I repeat-containing protein [Candidatus Zixiibacteriota bacterium]
MRRWGSGAELTFLTKPFLPTGLSAESISTSTISLLWNKHTSADKTIIERNDTLVWARGEGIVIYNDTGSNCKDTGLVPLTQYYYQAWSYSTEEGLSQYSDDFDTANAITLFKRGDANGDRIVTVADVIYLINYLFKGGPEPQPVQAGDANCDGKVNVSDVVYLINYLFKGGPPPPVC